MREIRKRCMKSHGDVEFYNPNVCYCSPDPPDPDPLIGQAAMSNAELSKEMAGVARDQLAWEKERAAKQDPMIAQIVNQQIQTGNTNSARADEQWNLYKQLYQPVEEKNVQDAMNFDSPARKEQMAAEAGADVTRSYGSAADQNMRTMAAMGINPNSGRFAGMANENSLAQARDTAGAMNKARRDTELQGMALRTGVAQLGRGLPSTGLAADSTALNAGNSAVGNMAAGSQIANANNMAAAQWFNGAVGGNNSAGSLMNNLYGGQLQAANMQQDAMGGIGSLVGTLGSAGIMAF